MTCLTHSAVCITMTSDKFLSRGIIVERGNQTKQDLWEAAAERKACGAFPHTSAGAADDVITRILEILPSRNDREGKVY